MPSSDVRVALDLTLLVPCLVALLILLMTFVFRNLSVAVISLAEIGLSLVWTIGLIGILGESVFITTLALPVVLIAIGSPTISTDQPVYRHAAESSCTSPTRRW